MGMDVHQDSLAVAYVAQGHGAEGMDLGAIGTRPWDLAPLLRQRPSTATPPLFVYDAGPGGSWLYRSLPPQGDDCWVVAPSARPQKAGDRVTTDRRAAVPCPVAVTRVSARGDRTRVDPPRARMKGVGLLPAASSSGAQCRQGSMTTAGHSHARRALVAGAWASRDPAQGSRPRPRRRDTPPPIIPALRWKAQGRRCPRDRRLGSRGPHAPVVTGARARALAGCMWAMARAVPVTLSDQQRGRMHPSTPQVPHV
jgi:hypothetical protein